MPPRNPWLCVSIVGILGVVCLLGMAGGVWLASAGKTMPGELIGAMGTALGALASFLVQVPRGQVGGGSADGR